MTRSEPPVVGAVIIGRNEGARLVRCLQSVAGQVGQLVYVDSGSSDGSVAAATSAGARVVMLDLAQPFTAARARNAGMELLTSAEFVLFIDGDCVLQPGFMSKALAAFATHQAAVVLCGRRREMFPEASIYNRLCDAEWDTPVGQALACGGDALMRLDAVRAVGGFRASLIAGEEPELCLRLRRAGGQIWRINAEMTLHDAAMTRFGQWWRRSVRAGHAFAEGAWLHGASPNRHWRREVARALGWALALPAGILGAAMVHPAGWLLVLLYPLQVLRVWWRDGGWATAGLSVLRKFAEAQGALTFYARYLRGRGGRLIEYK